jgi:hypothetical protein
VVRSSKLCLLTDNTILHSPQLLLAGELYVCGLGGSDHVHGDRLRPGGDCASADQVQLPP